MAHRLLILLLVAALLGVAHAKEEARKPRSSPPPTKTVDAHDVFHGETVPDPYRWLEPNHTPEVVAWDNAQMAYTRSHLDRFADREAVRKKLDEEFGHPGMRSLPTFVAGRRWYTHRPAGANHALVYVTDLEGEGEPRVVFDPNTWSEDGTAGLEDWVPSPNGAYVAYRRDEKGSEETTLFIRDLVTGRDLPDRITRTKFASIVWTPDSQGFLYTRMPDPESVPEGEAQHHRRVLHHRLGDMPLDDTVIYGWGRPRLESKWIYTSTDGKHIFLTRGLPYKDVDTFELVLDQGHWRLEPVVVGDKSRTWVDRVGDTYVLNTDKYRGTRDIRTMVREETGLSAWRAGLFEGIDAVIEDTYVTGDSVVIHIKEGISSRLIAQPLAGGPMRDVPLPGKGTVSGVATRPGDTRIWLRYESMDRPPTDYVCDLSAESLSLDEEARLATGIDPDGLVMELHHVPSKDGTKIPVTILRHKDTKLDGSAPTVLYGYGGFRVSLWPRFSRTRGLWAEAGGVWCVANLRGGAEFGEAWHKAGSRDQKQNVYDDFIAAADWLVDSGRASRERLAIQGGSNGGLLVAVCANQRPDLCAAVICGVPLIDMLRYHRFQYAATWTMEYGNPDVAAEYAWIRPYSPYHNIQKGADYPAMLVTTGVEDGRVNAFHARKLVARLQADGGGANPVLLHVDRDSGHGSTSLEHLKKRLVDEWSFLMRAFRDVE